MSAWDHEPIESAILIEFPAHAGEHVTMWFARTKTTAYFYEWAEGSALSKDDKPPSEVKKTFDVKTYDKVLSEVSTWNQRKPLPPEETVRGAVPGYMGVVSLYNAPNSRQMLLTSEDIAVCNTKQCDTWKQGRLIEALRFIPTIEDKSKGE
jgi:hypothetical protein